MNLSSKIKNYEINKTTFDVYACQSVGFRVRRNPIYLVRNKLDLASCRIFHPIKEFRIPHGASTICLDLLSGEEL